MNVQKLSTEPYMQKIIEYILHVKEIPCAFIGSTQRSLQQKIYICIDLLGSSRENFKDPHFSIESLVTLTNS